MQRHHRFALAVPLLCWALPLAAQDFEGVFTSRAKSPQGGGSVEMKASMKPGKYRMDIAMPGQAGSMSIIVDPAAGETYMVMPAQQMVMVMKMSEAEKMAEKVVPEMKDAKLTATGRKETVAGHQCEYYRMTANDQTMDICFATGLGGFSMGANLFGPPGRGGPAAAPAWARELMRKDAFPLKVVSSTGDAVWEIVSIEKKPVEASLFTIPSNYRRMEMPSMGRPPAD